MNLQIYIISTLTVLFLVLIQTTNNFFQRNKIEFDFGELVL